MNFLVDLFERFVLWVLMPKLPEPPIITVNPPPTMPPTPPAVPKYDWSTVQSSKHAVRVICDDMGLTLEQKNTLTATIGAESGWQSFYLSGPKQGQPVKCENRNRQGVLMSTDWGICQWNDYYHIKEITPHEALNNPEKAVRLMCTYWKLGRRTQWVAYSTGTYRKYL